MISKDLQAVFQRVTSWPKERQRQLAELAREIEAEMSNAAYQASREELRAIDEGLAGGTASEEEINTAFDNLRRHEGRVRKTRRS